jgi:hypothetical protein
MALNYAAPANDRQPYGSYRIDVFSLKAGRRMTLYGKAALCQFIDLEADTNVSGICERPLVIPNSKPQKVVDFWAECGGVGFFYILRRPSLEKDSDAWVSAYDQFQKWAIDQKARVIQIDPADFEDRRIRYDNWSAILQHLITHRGQLNDRLFERCDQVIKESATLNSIENALADVDTMLVRAAVFTLLARGNLSCDSLDSVPINTNTRVSRV